MIQVTKVLVVNKHFTTTGSTSWTVTTGVTEVSAVVIGAGGGGAGGYYAQGGGGSGYTSGDVVIVQARQGGNTSNRCWASIELV